jgi:hypothetical protein
MSRRSSARAAIPRTAYHGAHRDTVAAEPVSRWENGACVAFTHDLMSAATLPAEFQQCDVFVTDLPWRNGYDAFNERAGVGDGRTYQQFMRRVAEIVESVTAPTYLVTGRHALPLLPEPDAILAMMLNEDAAVAIGYRPGAEGDGRYGVVPEFLYALAQRYTTVGDFCCGYGSAGRFFLRSGKRAVLSDFNPLCIGYIAAHADGWLPRA